MYWIFWPRWTGSDITKIDAFYFTFISASTIGLGDISPAEYNFESILFTLPYLLVCLSVIALLLAIVGQAAEQVLDDENPNEVAEPNSAPSVFEQGSAQEEGGGQIQVDGNKKVMV